jgi:hypothetical protein
MRRGIVLTTFALFAPIAWADDAPASSIDELARRNSELEERVRHLESRQIEKEVENYLDESAGFAGSQGDGSIAPGTQRFRVNGQVRVRGEVRDSLYTDDASGDRSFNLVRMRVRIGFSADISDQLGVTIELQDVRLWGEEESTVGQLDNVDLKKGFFEVRDIAGQPIDAQVGRMVVWYGDQRLIGHLEWVDQGRSYDGVRVQGRPENWFLDGFAFKIREAVDTDDDQNFFGLYGGLEWLDVYALLLQDQLARTGETGVEGNSAFVTLGLRLHGKRGGWAYKAEVPVQVGKLNGDDLTAWAFSIMGAYTFENHEWQPQVYAELNWASGDDDPTDGDVGQFQTLFPTNHLHYGYADQVGWANIINLRVGVLVQPSAKWRIRFDYHHFRRPEEEGAWIGAGGGVVRPGAPGTSSHLADEFDVVVTWLPMKALAVELGWAIFLPGGFIEDTGPAPTAHFIYLQGLVRF